LAKILLPAVIQEGIKILLLCFGYLVGPSACFIAETTDKVSHADEYAIFGFGAFFLVREKVSEKFSPSFRCQWVWRLSMMRCSVDLSCLQGVFSCLLGHHHFYVCLFQGCLLWVSVCQG